MASPKTKVFDCYATLGVSPHADTETIQKAYDQLAEVHREWDDNSAEATASLQKLKNACETLTDVPRRWSYDSEVKQEYLRTHRKIIELDEQIGKQRDSKPHGVAAADPNVRANHETMARLAQTMAGFVRELRFLPGERDRHDDCRKREQELTRSVGELQWKFDSLCKSHQSLQDYLRLKENVNQTLQRLLEQEKKKARDAEARVARLMEDLRRNPAALSATDESTKVKHVRANGRKEDDSERTNDTAIVATVRLTFVKPAEGNKTGPTISDGHGGESPEVKDEDEEMSLVWAARQGGALPF